MVGRAQAWAQDNDFDFIVTGEVVGQRPMSQRKDTMPVVARESGAHDRLLRPLCAHHLPPTLPEREGWVDREKLFDFCGRSRKPQMALAKQYGFEDYAQPAGGCCFLTDANYAHKLADLWKFRPDHEEPARKQPDQARDPSSEVEAVESQNPQAAGKPEEICNRRAFHSNSLGSWRLIFLA